MEAKNPAEKNRTRKKSEKKQEQGLHSDFEFLLTPPSSGVTARLATISPDVVARAIASKGKSTKDGECASLLVETEPSASCEFHKAKLFEKKLLHDEELLFNVVFPDTDVDIIAHSLDLVTREQQQSHDFTQIPQISFTAAQRCPAHTGNYARTPYGVPRYPYKLPDSYVRYTIPDPTKREGLLDALEYDMDSEDEAFLEKQCHGVSAVTFEKMIDRLEKESYLATSERPENVIFTQLKTEENDDECDICGDGASDDANQIVYCDGKHCGVKVHQNCYGVPFIPDGDWLCCPCQEQLAHSDVPVIRMCCLCHHDGGALKRTTDGRYCHVVCGIWIPDAVMVFQRGRGITKWLDAIDVTNVRGRDAVCDICGVSGACISCDVAACKSKYHPSCAMKRQDYLMKTNFQYLFHDLDARNPAYSTLCSVHKKKHGANWRHVCRHVENKGFLTPCGNTFQTEQQVVAHISTCMICTATVNTTYVMTKKTMKEARQLKERPVPPFLCGSAPRSVSASLSHAQNVGCSQLLDHRGDVSFLKVIGQMPRKRLFIPYGSSVTLVKKHTDLQKGGTPAIARSVSVLSAAADKSGGRQSLESCSSWPTSKIDGEGTPATESTDERNGDQSSSSLEDAELEIELNSSADSDSAEQESEDVSKFYCAQQISQKTNASEQYSSSNGTVQRPFSTLLDSEQTEVHCVNPRNGLDEQGAPVVKSEANTMKAEYNILRSPVSIKSEQCVPSNLVVHDSISSTIHTTKFSESSEVQQSSIRASLKSENSLQWVSEKRQLEEGKEHQSLLHQPQIKSEQGHNDNNLATADKNYGGLKSETEMARDLQNSTSTKDVNGLVSSAVASQVSASLSASTKSDPEVKTGLNQNDKRKDDLEFFGISQDSLQAWFPDVPLEKVNQIVDFWVQKRRHKNNAYLLRRFDPYILCVNRPVYATSDLPCDSAMFDKLKSMRLSLLKTRHLINCTIRREESKLKRLRLNETIACMLTMSPLAKSLFTVLTAVKHLDKYHLFYTPLAPEISPELYIGTPHPMCFREMETKVKSNSYLSVKSFLTDLKDCFTPYVELGNASVLRKAVAKEYLEKVVAPLESCLDERTLPSSDCVRSSLPGELHAYRTVPPSRADKECFVEWKIPDATEVTELFKIDWQDLLSKGAARHIDIFSGNGEFVLLEQLKKEREAAELCVLAKRPRTEIGTGDTGDEYRPHQRRAERSPSSKSSMSSQLACSRHHHRHHHHHLQDGGAEASLPNVKHLKEYFLEFVDLFLECLAHFDKHKIFAFPVNDFIAPGYSKVIKHPMSLFTMKNKAREREYRRFSQVKKDFLYMCGNALMWNPDTSIYYIEAEKMKRNGLFLFKKLQCEIKRCIVNNEPLDFKRVLPNSMKGLAAPSRLVHQAAQKSSSPAERTVLTIPVLSSPAGVCSSTTPLQRKSAAEVTQGGFGKEGESSLRAKGNGETAIRFIAQTEPQTSAKFLNVVSSKPTQTGDPPAKEQSLVCSATAPTQQAVKLTVCSALDTVASPFSNGQKVNVGGCSPDSFCKAQDASSLVEQQRQAQSHVEQEMDVEDSPRAPQMLSDGDDGEDEEDHIGGYFPATGSVSSSNGSIDDDILEVAMPSTRAVPAVSSYQRPTSHGGNGDLNVDKLESEETSFKMRSAPPPTKHEQHVLYSSDSGKQGGAASSGAEQHTNQDSGGIISVPEDYPKHQPKKVQKSIYNFFFPKKN